MFYKNKKRTARLARLKYFFKKNCFYIRICLFIKKYFQIIEIKMFVKILK